ncbi:hypothetical protein [Flavobacterium sp. HNIBRBA15423]|uniref:hypothetical protein n=1 Tax=Flavobacterium sp. HNIBRBA15423 TaxID=3458683 RepID=UPI004043BFDD
MKNTIFFILFFQGLTNLFGQEGQIIKIHSIEEATNISLAKARELIKNRENKIIISYEYMYKLDDINIGDNDYVKTYEYDMDIYKKGEFVYILKVLINVDKNIHINTSLFKCTKQPKKG